MDSALAGDWAFIAGYKFPGGSSRKLHWKKRRFPGRCKIIVGDTTLEYESLDQDGNVDVPADTDVQVFEMEVKFTP